MSSYSRSTVSGTSSYSLHDFVQLVDLPCTVAVTSGNFTSNIRISRGDVLLVRSHLPSTLTISFHCTDSGGTKATEIPLDSNLKFTVLPPKPKTQDGQYQKTIYETVADLIKDCPTYFRANINYDDPYLPGFSVKSGDLFRFVRLVHDSKDNHVRLECTDVSGNLVRLSAECKGRFTCIPDTRSYTVRELINQARVPRRLKLSEENIQLKPVDISSSPVPNRSLDSNVDKCRSCVPELPLSFKGVIHLHKPPEVIEVSPWGDLDVRWKLPLDVDLHVRLFSQDDYELPVAEDKIISHHVEEFVEEYESKFPVLATLLRHGYIHPDLTNHLKNVSDIIVHRVKAAEKILCLDHRDKYFLMDSRLQGTFVEDPRTFEKVEELFECPVGTYFKVLDDVYTDYPDPVCLKCGDFLVLTAQKTKTVKKRWRKSTVDPCQVVRCQKFSRSGGTSKISLPTDLEIKMEELLDFNKNRPFTMDQIVSHQVAMPTRRMSVINRYGEEPLPLPSSFRMLSIVLDDVIVVSPLRYADAGTISPVLQTCVELSVRHSFLLAFGRTLDFPQGYFVFPKPTNTAFIRVEKIRTHVAHKLQTANSNDYEDINESEMAPDRTQQFLDKQDESQNRNGRNRPIRPSQSEGALAGIQLRKRTSAVEEVPKTKPIQRLSKVLSSMRKKKKTPKPESLSDLCDRDSKQQNEYHNPPQSPGATSVQDDPYEQINIQLGQSLVAESNTVECHQSRFPRTTSV